MRSVRLDDEMEDRLSEATRTTGQPASEIIRNGIRRELDELLSKRTDPPFAGVIGAIRSRGGNSRSTGRTFERLLVKETKRRK